MPTMSLKKEHTRGSVGKISLLYVGIKAKLLKTKDLSSGKYFAASGEYYAFAIIFATRCSSISESSILYIVYILGIWHAY